MAQLDLRTCKFQLKLHKRYPKIDMYTIVDDHAEQIISIGVPSGREDIAKFILRSCSAGQNVLNTYGIKSIKDFTP